MSDDYRERMLAITDALRAQRVGAYTSAPPIYRLAWRVGLRLRPPLYQAFGVLALGMGIWFGVMWGLLMWFWLWRFEQRSIAGAVVASLVAGTFFGLTMAAYYRRRASRLRLPALDGGSTAAE